MYVINIKFYLIFFVVLYYFYPLKQHSPKWQGIGILFFFITLISSLILSKIIFFTNQSGMYHYT
jgi:hypothetical protein